MPQLETAIPIARMLTPGGPEPWRYVTPLGFEWWANMTPLEQAHREGRLVCPHCEGRVQYCCGPIRVPYFRHAESSCLVTDPVASGRRASRPAVRAAMIRYGLARLLLEVLPPSTILNQERAFLGADGDLFFTLPSGESFIVVAECSPDGYASLGDRFGRYTESKIPIFWIFAGDLLYRRIQEAGVLADTRMDPLAVTLMEWGDVNRVAAKPYVDLAFMDTITYPIPKMAKPGSLLFYQPGRKREELGTLIGLRGVLPVPGHQNRWIGAAVRGAITRGQPHQVRFSLRRGFYLEQDLVVLRAYRKRVNHWRARERRHQAQDEALAKLRAEQLEAERQRPETAIQSQHKPQPDSEQEVYRPSIRRPQTTIRSTTPGKTYRKSIGNGMVQACPLKKLGPMELENCTYCDYRRGGDGTTFMNCGWPRRQ